MAHPGTNAEIFANIKGSLREGNVTSFLANCEQITLYIGNRAAYYAAAKPELVEMLEVGIDRLKFWTAMTVPPPAFKEMQTGFMAFAWTLQVFMQEFNESPDLQVRLNRCFDWLRSRTSSLHSESPLVLSPKTPSAVPMRSPGINPPITPLNVSGPNLPPLEPMIPDQQDPRTPPVHMFSLPFQGPPGGLGRGINQSENHLPVRSNGAPPGMVSIASVPAPPIVPANKSSIINTSLKFLQNEVAPAPVVPLKRSFSTMLSWEDWAALDEDDGDVLPALSAKIPLTVRSPPSNISKSPPQGQSIIPGFPSTSNLSDTPSEFTPDLQRTPSSTLQQENEGDGSGIKAHDANVEGDVSSAGATSLSLAAERRGSSSESAVTQTQLLSHNPRSHSPDILPSPTGGPPASTSSLNDMPKNSTPQRSTLPPTPDPMNFPGASISTMTSPMLTSHRDLNLTISLGDSVKENDGASTLPRASSIAPSVDGQSADQAKPRIIQQTESILEETNTEARRLCDPSSSGLLPIQAKDGNSTKPSPDTFGGTSLPTAIENRGTSHLASPLSSHNDVAVRQISIASLRSPPPSLETNPASAQSLRARAESLPPDDDPLAIEHGGGVKNGYTQSYSQRCSIEPKQGLSGSDPREAVAVANAYQSDTTLSIEPTKKPGTPVGALPRLDENAMEVDEDSLGPRASHNPPPVSRIAHPASRVDIEEIQIDTPEPMQAALEPLPDDNRVHSDAAKPPSLSLVTPASFSVSPSIASGRDTPVQPPEPVCTLSPPWLPSQNGFQQLPFAEENSLKLELGPVPRAVLVTQKMEALSGPPVDTSTSEERTTSTSDGGASRPNNHGVASTTTEASMVLAHNALDILRGQPDMSIASIDRRDSPRTISAPEPSVEFTAMASPQVPSESSQDKHPSSEKIIHFDLASTPEDHDYVEALRKIFGPLITQLHAVSNPDHNPDVVAAGVTDDDLVTLAKMGASVVAELEASNFVDATGVLDASASSLIRHGPSAAPPLFSGNTPSSGRSEHDVEAALTAEPITPDSGLLFHANGVDGDVEDMDMEDSPDVTPPLLRKYVPERDSVLISGGTQLAAQRDNHNDVLKILPPRTTVTSVSSSSTLQSRSHPLRIEIPPSRPFDISLFSTESLTSRPSALSTPTPAIVGGLDGTSEGHGRGAGAPKLTSPGSASSMLDQPPQPGRELCFIRGQSGLFTTETKFDLSGDDLAGIHRWMNRDVNFNPKDRHLCVHLHCFNARAFDGIAEALGNVAKLDDQWPPSGDHLFAVYTAESSSDGNLLYMPLAPPLLNARTSPVCFSPLARVGMNSLRIVQIVDCSELVFVLRLEQPIHEIEALAKLEHAEAQWNTRTAIPMVSPLRPT